MMFYGLLCNILFMPIIIGSNIPVTDVANETQILSKEKVHGSSMNDTTIPVEGGSILSEPNTLALGLSEGSDNKNTENIKGKSKIFARKGAGSPIDSSNESVVAKVTMLGDKVNPSAEQEKLNTSRNSSNVIKQTGTTLPLLTKVANTTKVSNITKPANITKIANITKVASTAAPPKKPLILNSDILETMTVKSFPETNSQLQSPNKSSYLANATNHPGMVMPIVITILLVPMFAVLGYMALKRGQEAWKNRHYKRMDFLLDGMYND